MLVVGGFGDGRLEIVRSPTWFDGRRPDEHLQVITGSNVYARGVQKLTDVPDRRR